MQLLSRDPFPIGQEQNTQFLLIVTKTLNRNKVKDEHLKTEGCGGSRQWKQMPVVMA